MYNIEPEKNTSVQSGRYTQVLTMPLSLQIYKLICHRVRQFQPY